jgi:DNA-binding response OmpR family regulator
MANASILIVEDEFISQAILEEVLRTAGYQITLAETTAAAWALLSSAQVFDAVLLDRNLPDGDGLALLAQIKSVSALARIPVIMQTAMTSPEEIQAGLQAGAHYYLTKPFDNVALLAIVQAAVKDYRTFLQLQEEFGKTVAVLSQLSQAKFTFQTGKQARDIAALLSHGCPDGRKVVLGLSELMLNAVEHGNLAITYEEKSRLLRADALQHEIEARLAQDEYASRVATVTFERTSHEIRFHICDQGVGFDWRQYLEMSPERVFDAHGRGIAMARLMSFDALEYMGKGNEVMAVIRLPQDAG